jgi:tRNA (mo5U34)-methyltransferase
MLPRGRSVRLGSLAVRQQADGLLVGPAALHPVYGTRYEPVPVPHGLTPQALQNFVSQWSWYHEIDLGNGVSTRPSATSLAEMERKWKIFALGDLRGRSVLDIGGMDGGFAFRAEQAGAHRVGVLDHYVWATDSDEYGRIFQEFLDRDETPPPPHESKAWHPDTLPTRRRFDVARQVLSSQVEPIVLDFMDCNIAEVGVWDVVLYLGVLYHMPDPLGALRRVRAVTGAEAIIETEAMVVPGHPEPLWRFFPGGELNHDRTNWWVPNMEALRGLTGAAGFSSFEVLDGEPMPDEEDGSVRHYRAVVRAAP